MVLTLDGIRLSDSYLLEKDMKYNYLPIDQTLSKSFCESGSFVPGGYDWHAHRWPHLLYAVSGALTVETESSLWLLPPQRAAWVAADVPHRTTYILNTQYIAVFVAPEQLGAPLPTRVFSVSPLAREMFRYSKRWEQGRDGNDELANQFFRTLVLLTRQWMVDEVKLRLPRPTSEPMQKVVAYILGGLDSAELEEAAALIAVSPRTLRRQMQREMQITWRQFLRDARMMRSMELLAAGDTYVTEVALAVGYNSLSAFNGAFRQFTGQNPSDYLASCVIGLDE